MSSFNISTEAGYKQFTSSLRRAIADCPRCFAIGRESCVMPNGDRRAAQHKARRQRE